MIICNFFYNLPLFFCSVSWIACLVYFLNDYLSDDYVNVDLCPMNRLNFSVLKVRSFENYAMNELRFILSIIFIISYYPIYSQSETAVLFDAYETAFSEYPQECIYIQPSKNIYETGEDLWFKAYRLDAQSYGLSERSKTLYLQMVSSKDSVVWQEIYNFENGIVSGHVYLDEKLPEGDYFLHGYTKYSFYNDSAGTISPRKIKLVNNITSKMERVLSNDNSFRFEVFPEGGNLVSGLASNLAFKATNGSGYPVDIEGHIYQDDALIVTFQTSHHGMGAVPVTPLPGKKYRIVLNNGREYPFPEIYPQGFVMQLSRQDKDKLEFTVSQCNHMPGQPIYLVGQMRGKICCIAKGMLKDNLKITIPLDEFAYQGIAEFTLFDKQLQPIAERSVYIHPEKKLHITAEPLKKSFLTREKASIKIKVVDENGMPVKVNLGISIYDQAYNDSDNPVNMLSYCYLTSRIRGKIYNPLSYFDENNSARTEAMDLLLLTQGWRRYLWNNQTFDGVPFLTDEITGFQTMKTKKKQENYTSEQLIQVLGADGDAQFIWADSTGFFTIHTDIMDTFKGGYLYLKPMLPNENKPKLHINCLFPAIDTVRAQKTFFYPFYRSTDTDDGIFSQYVISKDSTILLDEVTVTSKARKPFRDKFMGRLDSLAQLETDMPWVCPDGHLENYKDGYTAHHDPRYCPNPHHVPIEKRSKPVEGKSYYIFKPKYIGTSGAFIVEQSENVIYKAPVFSEEELLRKNNLQRIKGYYATREFYQPDEIDMQSSIPDARNTLLWAPSVTTDDKGEAIVSFYCSDINTVYIGQIEGIDGAGLIGTTTCEFRVMKY